MRSFLTICFIALGLVAVQAEEIKLVCNSKRGVDHVRVDIAMRSVEVEEFHTYQGFKTHLVLLFQDGGQDSAIKTHELDGEPSSLPRRSGPQVVSISPEKIAFSGSLHTDDRNYELDRATGLMVLKSIAQSGAVFGPFSSKCVAEEPSAVRKKNEVGS